MKLGIVSDSPADIPVDIAEQAGIDVIPAIMVIEGKEYIDGKTITREAFYERLPAMKTAPTTAAPSPNEFSSRYRRLLEEGCQHIISIHTAAGLTSIANIARKVAEDFPGKVSVVDSTSLSLGVGFQAIAAAEAALSRNSVSEVLQVVEATRQRIRVAAALDTMDYLRRSGRVPGAVTAIGGFLNIKPVVEVRESQVRPIGASRTTRNATEILLRYLLDQGPLQKLAILHTHAEERAQRFLQVLMEMPQRQALPREIRIVNVTSIIGTHVGPNGIGFAAVKAA